MKTPTNILNNPIQKSIYRSIRKKEILPSKLKAQNLNFPSSTEKVLNVFAKQSNGTSLNCYIFKDRYGRNLGSRTIYSNGLIRSIDIKRDPVCCDSGHNFPLWKFDTSNTLYTSSVKLGKKLLQKTKTFSEVYKMSNIYLKNKPQDLSNLKPFYQCVVRIKETFDKRRNKHISQQVLQIEGNKNPIKKSYNLNSQMKANGDTKIKSYTHSKNIELNTDNPYFALGLLRPNDMIKGRYRAITRENKLEPFWLIKNDNSFLKINLDGVANKQHLVNILGSKCEHLKQIADIHLALKNMISENVQSKKIFNGIEKHFDKLKNGARESKDAEISLYKKNNSEDLVFPNTGFEDNNPYREQVDLAGYKERNDFLKFLGDLKQNFSLFNRNYFEQL